MRRKSTAHQGEIEMMDRNDGRIAAEAQGQTERDTVMEEGRGTDEVRQKAKGFQCFLLPEMMTWQHNNIQIQIHDRYL